MRRLFLTGLLALSACAGAQAELTHPPLPDRILPATIDGLEVREEQEAAAAFRTSYDISLVADGVLFSLRRDGAVQGSLQIATLKAPYTTEQDEVRRGIRAAIETGRYRWFKLDGQWIGEQRLAELSLYLWFPPLEHLYEVLVVRPDMGIPEDLLRAIIAYQREETP